MMEDLSAERAVFGAILADNTRLAKVAEFITPEHFANQAHARIWQAMLALDGRQQRIDHLTLAEELKVRGQLAQVGGPPYLMGLDLQVPFAQNAVQYAQVVRNRAADRWHRAGVAALELLRKARS